MINLQEINNIKKQLGHAHLVAVTKYVGLEEIKALMDAGIYDFGENRVSVFLDKYKQINDPSIVWHFIGHLQSKKAKKMINQIDYLHSLESLSLAEEIQKRREAPLACFLEVNISGDQEKYGLKQEKVIDFYDKIKDYDKIKVIGLMGMARHTSDQVKITHDFQILLDLKNQFKSQYNLDMKLSMGMSNDYRLAVNLGSDFVRIGSLLYKEDQ